MAKNRHGAMKLSTVIIVIGIIAVFLFVAGYISLPSAPPGSVYAGRMKVNLVQVKRVDGATYDIVASEMRMIHGSMDYNDKVGTIASNSITGDLKPTDGGKWYLVVDYGTNTTCWLDSAETAKQSYVTRVFGSDGDIDGFDEEYVELYFGNLGPLEAGESYHEVEVTLVNSPARISSITCTSLTNTTSVSATAFGYTTVTGYIGGFTEGDLARLAKLQLYFDATGNTTFADNTQWQLVHLKVGPYTFTASQFGGYDLSNTRFQLTFGDQNNWQGGKDLYYAKNAGTLWCPYELKAYTKFSATNTTCYIKWYTFVYSPDGTISSSTVFNRTVSFNCPA